MKYCKIVMKIIPKSGLNFLGLSEVLLKWQWHITSTIYNVVLYFFWKINKSYTQQRKKLDFSGVLEPSQTSMKELICENS